MTTRELIDAYMRAEKSDKAIEKLRRQFDRPELYDYEQEIGKQLIEFNVADIKEFLLHRIKGYGGRIVSAPAIDTIASGYRNVVNWYNANFTPPVFNAWYDKSLRAKNLFILVSETTDAYTTEDMENLFKKLRTVYREDRADYTELLIRLLYCGVPDTQRILTITAEDINDADHTVRMKDHSIVNLDERTYSLLKTVHDLPYIVGRNYNFAMVDWRGSYIKVIVRPKEAYNYDERELIVASAPLHKVIKCAVRDTGSEKNANYLTFYYLGFYDALVREFGRERANKMLVSMYDEGCTRDFHAFAARYNVPPKSYSQYRNKLIPYIHD